MSYAGGYDGPRFVGGLTNLGNTAGTTTVGGLAQLVLVGGNNITLSQSVSAGSATITIVGGAGGGAAGGTLSNWFPVTPVNTAVIAMGNGTMFIHPIVAPLQVSATEVNFYASVSVSTSSNSSHEGTLLLSCGIYTRNASTLSLLASGSSEWDWTNTSNVSLASLSGAKMLGVPINVNMTPGEYFVAMHSRTSSGGANWFTMSNLVQSGLVAGCVGPFLSASNSSNQFIPGFGIWSNTSFSTAMPDSIAISDVKGAVAGQAKFPLVEFCNVTF